MNCIKYFCMHNSLLYWTILFGNLNLREMSFREQYWQPMTSVAPSVYWNVLVVFHEYFIQTYIFLYICSFINSYRLFINIYFYILTHSFKYVFIYQCIYQFIHSLTQFHCSITWRTWCLSSCDYDVMSFDHSGERRDCTIDPETHAIRSRLVNIRPPSRPSDSSWCPALLLHRTR